MTCAGNSGKKTIKRLKNLVHSRTLALVMIDLLSGRINIEYPHLTPPIKALISFLHIRQLCGVVWALLNH